MIHADKQRIVKEFADLAAIDSVSFYERRMADRMKKELSSLGFSVSEDDAAEKLREEREKEPLTGKDQPAGNLYGFLKGDLPGDPILLCAHLDTVKPGHGKKAVFREDGTIASDGSTVLGADDAAGLAEILEGIRCVQENHLPHRDIEVFLPVAEEAHCRGSAVFDFSRIRSKEAYVFDLSGPVGSAAVKAPTIMTFSASVKGKAAHAGFAPEEGIHAVAILCDAVTRIPHGRVAAGTEGEMTINIGSISGGGATNIVPDFCTCTGEIRSCSHKQVLLYADQIRSEFEDTAAWYGASASVETRIKVKAYETEKDSPVVSRFLCACSDLALPGELVRTFGGSDNNNLAAHGIPGIVLSCGMENVHGVQEFVRTEDLVLGAQLVADLITE